MKTTAAVLSPLVAACMMGISAAQESRNIQGIVENYEYSHEARNQVSGSVGLTQNAGQNAAAAASSRVAAFNAAQGGGNWHASIDRRNGQVKVLYGGTSKRYEGDPESAALSFLQDSQSVLGLRSDLADIKTVRVDATPDKNHVRWQQTYAGLPVDGAFVLVHATKDGQITMVQNDYVGNIQPVNARLVSQETAVSKVMADLQASADKKTTFGPPRAAEMISDVNGQYRFVWKVTVSSSKPLGFWVCYVDAENAEILSRENQIMSLATGSGQVYKNNSDWQTATLSTVSLPYLYTESEQYATGGLWGRHADVYDNEGDGYGNDPWADDLKFIYNPYGLQKPWFDAATAYYRINTAWTWWDNNVIKKYGPANPDYFYNQSNDPPIAVIINVTTTPPFCNAYYAPEIQDHYYLPGFAFGNEEECASGSEDLVIDEGIVAHEYTHAMMEWCYFGSQFGGAVDGYGRAMGEGNADWFAYLLTDNPIMGDVAFVWTEEGYLRNLDNDRMYPADVDEPTISVPEEHYTGEIWGGYLYDLAQILGKDEALKYVYQGMFYFSPSGGFKTRLPDFYDAISAQAKAELDKTGKQTNTLKAWGAMASRGLLGRVRAPYRHASNYFGTGKAGSDAVAYFSVSFGANAAVSTQGRFLKAGACNEYPIEITTAGLQLNVKATGSDTSPSLVLYNTSSQVAAVSTNNTANEAALHVNVAVGGYSVMACGEAIGKYTMQITTSQGSASASSSTLSPIIRLLLH